MNVLLGEKLNSSAVCGILSKPTYAHGATARITTIEASHPMSLLTTGLRFENEKSCVKNDPANKSITTTANTTQNIYCRLPEKLEPFILIQANINNISEDSIISVIYTSQPATVYNLPCSKNPGIINLKSKLNAEAFKATIQIYPKVKNHDEKNDTYLPNPKYPNAKAPPDTGNFSTNAP